MSRLRACAISTSTGFAAVGTLSVAGQRPRTFRAISCFAPSPTGCRPISWVTSMAKAGVCSTALARLRKPDRAPWIRVDVLLTFDAALSSAASGTGGCSGWRCLPTALPGMERPIPASQRLRSRSPARAGTAEILRFAGQAIEGGIISMKTGSVKPVRCAIYTRVSTDQGPEQDFNSLDAQYDASQAYIRSQAHAGWTLLRAKYVDGGFSGGNTDRPALQRLLQDIQAGRIDVIVVYKVDRLTRSLADFAKLVELFDQHSVSFVSVTQQFNTTTSMGRLTLNVLLSFAQFEREVTSERRPGQAR
jgi:predicted site-specific integrase-resolvase